MTHEHDRFTHMATIARNAERARRPWSDPRPADGGVVSLTRGMGGYLRAVADAIGVPAEGTTFEISDTITAYLALSRRWVMRPDQDVMLVWGEHDGWAVSVETDPGETPMVIARFGGADPVPEPDAVARFVTDALASRSAIVPPATAFTALDRVRLAERLTPYASASD